MLTTTAVLCASLILTRGAPLPEDVSTSDSAAHPTQTNISNWSSPNNMTDFTSFSVEAYTAGQSNLQILSGSPHHTTNGDFSVASTDDAWDGSINSVRVVYPKGSINPAQSEAPIGGAEFYAHPMDVSHAQNVTLSYEVFFPSDFDFAKGGKLPGLYGGREGCSGGASAEHCFSTRLMWRQGGLGELYMYAPKTKQTPRLCSSPPLSVCDKEVGLSIGRGAWTFARGAWTTIREDIWLNTPGLNDGGFNIWINGQLVLTADDVYYRGSTSSPSRRARSMSSMENEGFHIRDDDDDDDPEVTMVVTSIQTVTAQQTSMITETITAQPTSIITATVTAESTVLMTQTVTAEPTIIATVTVTSTPQLTTVSAPAPPPITVTAPAPPPVVVTAPALPPMFFTLPAPPPVVVTAPPQIVTVTVQALAPVPTPVHPVVIVARPKLVPLLADHHRHRPQAVLRPIGVPIKAHRPTLIQPAERPVGFKGLHFSTFFGGHSRDWASPKDQHSFFRRFHMKVND